MTEYIRREDLMERVGRWQLNTREAIAEMIMSVPSVDVVERKRGLWLKNAFSVKCSACGEMYFSDDYLPDFDITKDFNYNYCPNCGADMRHSDD